jgi:hypothetical protein
MFWLVWTKKYHRKWISVSIVLSLQTESCEFLLFDCFTIVFLLTFQILNDYLARSSILSSDISTNCLYIMLYDNVQNHLFLKFVIMVNRQICSSMELVWLIH